MLASSIGDQYLARECINCYGTRSFQFCIANPDANGTYEILQSVGDGNGAGSQVSVIPAVVARRRKLRLTMPSLCNIQCKEEEPSNRAVQSNRQLVCTPSSGQLSGNTLAGANTRRMILNKWEQERSKGGVIRNGGGIIAVRGGA